MNYILGKIKIPKDLTVAEIKTIIEKLEKLYNVKVGIAHIKDLNPTFYELKMKSNQYPRKLKYYLSERIDFVIDNQLEIYKNPPKGESI